VIMLAPKSASLAVKYSGVQRHKLLNLKTNFETRFSLRRLKD
jgi:hypothetical protein